jgi:glycosyltransferase involved in cell wall biosynthesis
MKHITLRLPAWLLKLLPVRFARSCAVARSPADSDCAVPPNSATRQLLVDVSVIHQSDARTGIQRVVRALFLQLLNAPPAGYCVRPIFATAQHGYRYANPDFLNQLTPPTDAASQPTHGQDGDIFLGLDLVAHLIPKHQAQILQLKRAGVKVHVMVYDLLPLQHPEWFNDKTTRNFKRWIKWLAVYADSAVCISETVKLELATWLHIKFGMPSESLPASTIVLGADIEASAPSEGLPPNAEFLLARMRNIPAVLMVGTLEPRKGHDQALAAFELLWKHPSNAPLLVMVGRPGWKTEALQTQLRTHSQIGKKLFWFEDASDELLNRLYATCRGVLVASRAEGFGLPLIEAALHGKPVLARDIPVFREIKVAGVNYFKDNTPQGLATEITNWAEVTVKPSIDNRNTGLHTWQLSAAQLLSALDLPYSISGSALAATKSNCNPRGTLA